MNIAIINPIAASPAITPSGMLMPRVPSIAGDMQRLKEVNIVELGRAIANRGHEVTLILGGPYLDGKEWDLGRGLRIVPVQTVMRFPFHPGLLPMTPELMGHPALQQADVIQTGEFHQLPTFFACVAASDSGVPLVLWQETFRPMRFPGSLYQRIYGTTLGRRVLTTTERFIPRTT
ncbi:MAG: glycosyltransferase, partial [Thermoplasmata archaeon]